jgi:hypothetical protein
MFATVRDLESLCSERCEAAMAGTERSRLGCAIMKRFFFDLVGDIRAHDFMGHECSPKRKPKRTRHSLHIASDRNGQASPDQGTSSLSAMNVAQRYSRHQ